MQGQPPDKPRGNPFLKRGMTMKQQAPVIDFSTKKRSNSEIKDQENKEKGTAFLRAAVQIPEKPKKSYFMDKEPISANSLLNQINLLSSSQAFKVALSLNIRPPSIETLQFFVSRISTADQPMLERVQSAIYTVTNMNRVPQSRSTEIATEYPTPDLRYKLSMTSISVIDKPMIVGQSHINFTFQLPELEPHQHVVVQSFLVGVSPPSIQWPASLVIRINGVTIKPAGQFSFSKIDLSQFPAESTVTIQTAPEGSSFVLVIRVLDFTSIKDFIEKIKNSPSRSEVFNEIDLSLICPITGFPLKDPGKGINCTHTQAFEIKEYIKLGIQRGSWICPICGLPTPPNVLMYSHATKNALLEFSECQPTGEIHEESDTENVQSVDMPILDDDIEEAFDMF